MLRSPDQEVLPDQRQNPDMQGGPDVRGYLNRKLNLQGFSVLYISIHNRRDSLRHRYLQIIPFLSPPKPLLHVLNPGFPGLFIHNPGPGIMSHDFGIARLVIHPCRCRSDAVLYLIRPIGDQPEEEDT